MTQVFADRTTATPPGDSHLRWQPPPPPPVSRLHRAGAVVGLALLVCGVPAALALTVGWPLPSAIPTAAGVRAVLSAPLEWGLVINALALVVWTAWAHFTLCVAVEVLVAVRGARAGSRLLAFRVPFGGLPQDLARRLVQASLVTATLAGTITLTGPSGTILTPARPAAAAQPIAVAPAGWVLPQHSSDLPPTAATVPATPPSDPEHAAPVYVVQPPHGGHYDSLWAIAERYLGDGQRWREIYQLNEGRTQPAQRELTRPELIRPGWRLLLPADATGLPLTEPAAEPAPGWVPEPLLDGDPEPSPHPRRQRTPNRHRP